MSHLRGNVVNEERATGTTLLVFVLEHHVVDYELLPTLKKIQKALRGTIGGSECELGRVGDLDGRKGTALLC